MSKDIIADTLNQIMNARRSRQDSVTVKSHSKLLISLLALAKLKGYIKDYKLENKALKIEINKLHGCRAIKPRYTVKVDDIDKYVKRYLPAQDIGIIIISTPKGLMAHQTAQDKNLGGSLIAYFY